LKWRAQRSTIQTVLRFQLRHIPCGLSKISGFVGEDDVLFDAGFVPIRRRRARPGGALIEQLETASHRARPQI
jgi:hypothetical protein